MVGPSALHSAGSSQLLRWAEAPLPPEIQSVQVNRRGLPLPQEEAAVEETKGMGGGGGELLCVVPTCSEQALKPLPPPSFSFS